MEHLMVNNWINQVTSNVNSLCFTDIWLENSEHKVIGRTLQLPSITPRYTAAAIIPLQFWKVKLSPKYSSQKGVNKTVKYVQLKSFSF